MTYLNDYRSSRRPASLLLISALTLAGCSGWSPPSDAADGGPSNSSDAGVPSDGGIYTPPAGSYPRGLHVVANQIQDESGNVVVLHGVNHSGTEYQCTKNGGIFDGENTPAAIAGVAAIAGWKANAVRVPLNETCWFGSANLFAEYSGAAYRGTIEDYVSALHAYNLVPILELHWSAPGDGVADAQTPLPGPHSAEFWGDVAKTFAADTGVIFEPFNEPFADSNSDTTVGWECWRDGCMQAINYNDPTLFPATGYQALVNAIRAQNAPQIILLGGLQYSNTLSHWLDYQPVDTLSPPQLGASWHIYSNNPCRTVGCWDGAPAAVAAQVPLLATEIGENDCKGAFITGLMNWLEGHNSGYLAWSWNANNACVAATQQSGGAPYALISSYDGTANNSEYAQTFHDRLASF